jgi:hypothetical protein
VMAADLRRHSEEELVRHLAAKHGHRLYRICRGSDAEAREGDMAGYHLGSGSDHCSEGLGVSDEPRPDPPVI